MLPPLKSPLCLLLLLQSFRPLPTPPPTPPLCLTSLSSLWLMPVLYAQRLFNHCPFLLPRHCPDTGDAQHVSGKGKHQETHPGSSSQDASYGSSPAPTIRKSKSFIWLPNPGPPVFTSSNLLQASPVRGRPFGMHNAKWNHVHDLWGGLCGWSQVWGTIGSEAGLDEELA